MNKKVYECLTSEKKAMDILQINDLTRIDLEICEYVSSQIKYIGNKIVFPKKIPLKRFVDISVNSLQIFGDDIVEKVWEILHKAPIEFENTSKFGLATEVSYYVYDGIVQEDSGFISGYTVSNKLYEWGAILFGHEHLHALKDTNYKEYKDFFSFSEVVPMFYELAILDSDDILKKKVVNFRLNNLFRNKKEFLMFNGLVEFSNKPDPINKYVRNRVGCYLNSFYYAIILYSMYQQSPKKILDLVSKVLKKEMTTKEMLIQLNIYRDIKVDVFEKELGNVRKLVR